MNAGPWISALEDYNSLEERGIKLFGRTQDAERWDIYRYNNLVHNTLTIDGQYQRVDGYAKIDSWSDTPNNMSLVSNLSEIYNGLAASVKRGIALKDENYVVVRDEVQAPGRDIAVRWTLLTPAEVRIIDARTVELSQKGKKMFLLVDSESPIQLKTWSTVPTHDYDAPNPGTQLVGFEAIVSANSTKAFNVFISPDRNGVKQVAPLGQWPATSRK